MKKLCVVLVVMILVIATSGCVTSPSHGGSDHAKKVEYIQPFFYGFNNEPVRFVTPAPAYTLTYNPYVGIIRPIISLFVAGLLALVIIDAFDGHHHHH